MSDAISAAVLRKALLALPGGTSQDAAPAPAHIYLAPSHVKALNPDVQLVTGMRGAGKTFWWSALQDGAVRQLVGRAVKWPPLNENTEVRTGLGSKQAPDEYPDRDHLRHLMADFEAAAIWRAVLAWQFVRHENHPLRECDSWATRTRYVTKNPDAVDRLFQERDAEFDERGVYLIVLFDSLDRFAHDWKAMYGAIRGLLRTARELLSYRRLRVKVFLPAEQSDSDQIAGFADESGVVPSVNLTWPRRDLYGLLWHHLGNGPEGKAMRGFLGGGDWPVAGPDEQCAFSVPRELVRDENRQRETFHRIAGSSMGPNHRRGVPYAWLTDHLADAERKVSPRSFLAALREAASDTAERHPGHAYALHYDSIRRGALEGSKIRVHEIEQDYPWVGHAMVALAGMAVPLEPGEIAERWRSAGVLENLGRLAEQDEVRSLPRRLGAGAEGVSLDLESLGVFYRMLDGRVNIPNVFRVGYRLGRKGGVRAMR